MESEQHLTQSALRALDVLEAVGKEGRPIGLSELARRIGLHKSLPPDSRVAHKRG